MADSQEPTTIDIPRMSPSIEGPKEVYPLEWKNIRLSVPSKKAGKMKKILKGLSGHVDGATTTAIMGKCVELL